MVERTAHPANARGDFYVELGCCLACEVPFTEAPGLFAWATSPHIHCYVKRQPATSVELDQMIEAARSAEFECIRYRGADRLIHLRLIEAGAGNACDRLPPDLLERQRLIDQALEAERQRKFAMSDERPAEPPT